MKKKESDLQINPSLDNDIDSSFEELEQFSYAEFLEEENEITMDFSFEELMDKVEEKQTESKPKSAKVVKFNQNVIFKYVGGIAACGLIAIGSLYALNENQEINHHQQTVEIVQHQLKSAHLSEESKQDEVKLNIEEPLMVVETPKEIGKINILEQNQPIKIDHLSKNTTKEVLKPEELVVMNGETIEDEKEAEAIALNALKLLAKNLHKGNEAVDQLKHLSIEL